MVGSFARMKTSESQNMEVYARYDPDARERCDFETDEVGQGGRRGPKRQFLVRRL